MKIEQDEYRHALGISDSLLQAVKDVMNEMPNDDKKDDKKKKKDDDKPYKAGGKTDTVEIEPKDDKRTQEYSVKENARKIVAHRKKLTERDDIGKGKHNRPQDEKRGEKTPVKQGSSKIRDEKQTDDEGNEYDADKDNLSYDKQKKKLAEALNKGHNKTPVIKKAVLRALKKEKNEKKQLALANNAKKAGASQKEIMLAMEAKNYKIVAPDEPEKGKILVHLRGKVVKINKKDWPKYKKKGYGLAEQVEDASGIYIRYTHKMVAFDDGEDTFEIQDLDEAAMTRQHFQMFADMIKDVSNPKDREMLASKSAEIFRQSNPRFDVARFRKAAGFKE